MLSEEDYALLKDREKKADKKDGDDDKADTKKKSKKGSKADAEKETKPEKQITVEFDGIEDRVMRLTPYSSDLSDAIVNCRLENASLNWCRRSTHSRV